MLLDDRQSAPDHWDTWQNYLNTETKWPELGQTWGFVIVPDYYGGWNKAMELAADVRTFRAG